MLSLVRTHPSKVEEGVALAVAAGAAAGVLAAAGVSGTAVTKAIGSSTEKQPERASNKAGRNHTLTTDQPLIFENSLLSLYALPQNITLKPILL